MFTLLKDKFYKNDTLNVYAPTLKKIDDVWHDIFKHHDLKYSKPKLALHKNKKIRSSHIKVDKHFPLYDPKRKKIYLSKDFNELVKKFIKNIPSIDFDFARACITAHEYGHHVQLLTQTMPDMKAPQWYARLPKIKRAQIDRKVELDADYLAGVWAHHAHKNYNSLDNRDIEAAELLFSNIGSDNIHHLTGGEPIDPILSCHGTSEQRRIAFLQGLKDGSSKLDLKIDPWKSLTKSIILREPVGG